MVSALPLKEFVAVFLPLLLGSLGFCHLLYRDSFVAAHSRMLLGRVGHTIYTSRACQRLLSVINTSTGALDVGSARETSPWHFDVLPCSFERVEAVSIEVPLQILKVQLRIVYEELL